MEQLNLTMKNLENLIDGAKKENAKYIGVKVALPHAPKPEIIINPSDNFDNKLTYYKSNYTEVLTHKMDADVKIVGFTYGNSLSEIEDDLL